MLVKARRASIGNLVLLLSQQSPCMSCTRECCPTQRTNGQQDSPRMNLYEVLAAEIFWVRGSVQPQTHPLAIAYEPCAGAYTAW